MPSGASLDETFSFLLLLISLHKFKSDLNINTLSYIPLFTTYGASSWVNLMKGCNRGLGRKTSFIKSHQKGCDELFECLSISVQTPESKTNKKNWNKIETVSSISRSTWMNWCLSINTKERREHQQKEKWI